MGWLGKLLSRIALGFAALVGSHAALIIAHTFDWFPEQQLASLLIASPDILQIEWVRWGLLAILTFLIWAVADYFLYRRHRDSIPALVQQTPASRRPILLTPASVYSFLNGYPIVRETDQAIANDLGLQVEEDHFPADALANAAQHFGIASLADLEKLLREHQQTVIELSRYFRPKGTNGEPAKLPRGHSVHMLLETLAARTGSVDRYMNYVGASGAVCAPAFGQNVIDAYKQICSTAHG